MDDCGQIYFAPEDEIPLADLKRMQNAELTDVQLMELARRAQVENDAKLLKELQDAFRSSE